MKETPKPSAQLVSELVRIVTAGAVLAGCKPMVEITPTINQDPTKENPNNTLVIPELTETNEAALVQLPVGSEPTANPTAEPTAEVTSTEVLSSETMALKPASEVPELSGIKFNIDSIQQLYPQLSNLELLAATNGMQGDAMRYTVVVKATEGDKSVLVLPLTISQDGKEYEANYPSYFDAQPGGVLASRMEGVKYTLVDINGNEPLTIYWNQEYPNVGQTSGITENNTWKKVELAVENDGWPFPEDPVVESIKLTEDEMKEKNTKFYNEVAPILSGSGIVVEQWMQHPDTGEVFMLVHHKDGGGQFMMTDYEYSNGHVLFGFNTRETEIAMENKWLQPADDGRLLAITLQNALNGKTMDSLFMDLAGMAHLRNRVGMGNLPGTLETMKAAIAAERAAIGSDKVNFVYLLTMFGDSEILNSDPFPEMHTFMNYRSGPYVNTDMILTNNFDGSLLVMNGMQISRKSIEPTEVFLRGDKTITRVENNEELKNKFARMPKLPNYFIMEGMYGHILGTTMANLAENSMEMSWFGLRGNDFLAEPVLLPDYALVDIPLDSLTAYYRGETDDLPEKYIQNLNEWVNRIFIRAQLVK